MNAHVPKFYHQKGFHPAPPARSKPSKNSENISNPDNLKLLANSQSLLVTLRAETSAKLPLKLPHSDNNANKANNLDTSGQLLSADSQKLTSKNVSDPNLNAIRSHPLALNPKSSFGSRSESKSEIIPPNFQEKVKKNILHTRKAQKPGTHQPIVGLTEPKKKATTDPAFPNKLELSSKDLLFDKDDEILHIKIKKVKSSQEQEPRNQLGGIDSIRTQYLKPYQAPLTIEKSAKAPQSLDISQQFKPNLGPSCSSNVANRLNSNCLENSTSSPSSKQPDKITESPKSLQLVTTEATHPNSDMNKKQIESEILNFSESKSLPKCEITANELESIKSCDVIFTILGNKQRTGKSDEGFYFKQSPNATTSVSEIQEIQTIEPRKQNGAEYSGYDFMISLPKYNQYFDLNPLLIGTLDF